MGVTNYGPIVISTVDGIPLIGQHPMVSSIPVVIASDQTPIPVTGSFSATTTAVATAADPAYVEGTPSPLSQDLSGHLRVVGTISVAPATYQSAGDGEYNVAVDDATAVSLTVPPGAKYAQINVNGTDMRYRDDGTDPTATVGMPVAQGAGWFYSGPLSDLTFIAQSGSGTLDVSYYK